MRYSKNKEQYLSYSDQPGHQGRGRFARDLAAFEGSFYLNGTSYRGFREQAKLGHELLQTQACPTIQADMVRRVMGFRKPRYQE